MIIRITSVNIFNITRINHFECEQKYSEIKARQNSIKLVV